MTDRTPNLLLTGLLLALLAVGCQGDGAEVPPADAADPASTTDAPPPPTDGLTTVVDRLPLPDPATGPAAEPNLFAASDGRVHVTWFERLDDADYALRFATLEPGGETWSAPRTIVERQDFFVNWADFPSIHELPDGTLAAHWLLRTGDGPVDYDVQIAWSEDGGDHWSDPVVPHRDGTESEHGFVSVVPVDPDERRIGALWLDARNLVLADSGRADGPRAMTLRWTTLTPEGLGEEVLLDDQVCDCCQTSAAMTSQGPVAVYRDRTDDEIRDISIVREVDGRWTEPAPIHDDGWQIAACPVNGPMIAADGDDVVVAWYTRGSDDKPRVRVAFSSDAGASFGTPVRVDEGNPGGRVAVELLPGGEALVSWLENEGERATVRLRTVATTGAMGESIEVAATLSGRSSGFPRMARAGSDLVFAWTDSSGDEPGVRTARARLVGNDR